MEWGIMKEKPGLYGLFNTNRDFTSKDAWGKNQFNSSFPAALCCYLSSKNIQAVYLCIQNRNIIHDLISVDDIFGIKFNDEDTYFAFESQYTPYQKYVINSLPRTDLVIQRKSTGLCLSGLEVKLTALPDNITCDLSEDLYGCEIVVRPDTIVYLASSIAAGLSEQLRELIPDLAILDWSDAFLVLEKLDEIISTIKRVSFALESNQKAFLLQPIWKTNGKSPNLADNCLDVFVWSDSAFCYFISKIVRSAIGMERITRQARSIIWLFKMLSDIKQYGRFNHQHIIDTLSYNTRNDKAFAVGGSVTNKFMKCERLTKPAILKTEIKKIILGDGQNLLSPERRFDAILSNTPGLFE
jgi:HindVP restriction endonuclease